MRAAVLGGGAAGLLFFGFVEDSVPATILLVYLVSGRGDASENARSNDARSSEGMSETAT
jgi:hypothetical protein